MTLSKCWMSIIPGSFLSSFTSKIEVEFIITEMRTEGHTKCTGCSKKCDKDINIIKYV